MALLAVLALYVGLRLFALHRPIEVYVRRVAPMPVELASELHVEEHKIDRMVTIDSPYDQAAEKPLSQQEIKRLRSQVVWSSWMPPFFDSLVIVTPTNVVAQRMTRRVMREYHLVKKADRWRIQSSRQSQIQTFSPE
jgi:hypothetical protein